jgi:hypothetical protein
MFFIEAKVLLKAFEKNFRSLLYFQQLDFFIFIFFKKLNIFYPISPKSFLISISNISFGTKPVYF